jgi:hypothetical protein
VVADQLGYNTPDLAGVLAVANTARLTGVRVALSRGLAALRVLGGHMEVPRLSSCVRRLDGQTWALNDDRGGGGSGGASAQSGTATRRPAAQLVVRARPDGVVTVNPSQRCVTIV